ncbi:DNA mismatch repair protein-like protein muts [Halenospora varia]|nr:DNA mismatch repair protein-like protein muts [Halenospora varia]
MATPRPSTSHSYASTSYQNGYTTSTSQPPYGRRPSTGRPGTARPSTGRRSRACSVIGGGESQQIICAINEGRGITPTVGLAFINISTGEAVLSQICDNQFYARTLNKLQVFEPTEILIVSTAAPPNVPSKMYRVVEENIVGAKMVAVDRKYWSETTGLEFLQQLAFSQDLDALRVLKYIELKMSLTFAFHSLRIKYQPSEGSMMIDLSTIQSLELIQNIHDAKSRHCLFGIMNDTLTPMGSRFLRSNILQPSTQPQVLSPRYEAVEELSSNDDMFYQTRQGLISLHSIHLIIIPTRPDIKYLEQSVNNILMLKNFVEVAPRFFEILVGAHSELLVTIRENCRPENTDPTLGMINKVINEDVTYQKTPLDLRNQRIYAVRSGVSGLLDVARQTFKEATSDVHQHATDINQRYEMQAETKFDNSRRYYFRVSESDFDGRPLPDILINRFRKKGFIECQTLELVKLNQRIEDAHEEVICMSDKTVEKLLDNIRGEIQSLFKVCESIALLDMIVAFVNLAINGEYVKPEIGDTLVIEAGRHPVKEKLCRGKAQEFVPNDVYGSRQTRFQIITGCNMSGKSTYIRSIALLSVMAQVGSFVPARFATFPIIRQLFTRVSVDDSIEANVSTFASEMRETAFILRNIDKHSLVIIDELGRGTSTRDGLAIALSIAEALVESKALIWFVTHFRELAQIMQHRPGVVNSHLFVDTSVPNTLTMTYKIHNSFGKEDHYGLKLAKLVELPPQVLEVAEMVTKTLDDQVARKKRGSKAVAIAKRRKLVLNLREMLQQAVGSPMDDKVLLGWLRRLQEEFVGRMEKIEREAEESESEEAEDEEVVEEEQMPGREES